MKMITIEGTIGAGKSSLAELIGNKYNSLVKYESTDSQLLERWYKETEEERQKNRTAFHCQIEFLDRRHKMIMECMLDKRQGFAILDRSIFTDYVFAYEKYIENEINETEWYSYNNIRNMAMREINALPQKAPHLTIYIRVSFETAMKRVNKRARDIEVNADDSMKDWFYKLWKTYDDFMMNQYDHSEVFVINGDEYDFIESEQDQAIVMNMIEDKLKQIGVIEHNPKFDLIGKRVRILAPWFEEYSRHVNYKATIREVFTDDKGQYFLCCEVEGQHQQVILYEGQYRII